MVAWCKKHYHWIIATILLVQLGVTGGAANNYVGLHLIPVTEALGISRTVFSLSTSIRALVGMGSTLLSGTLIMRLGYRFSLTACLLVASGSYFLYGAANNFIMLLTADILWGLTIGLCSSSGVGAPRVISAWFHKHRGTVLGVVTAATGLGGSVLSILQNTMIQKVSWRWSFYSLAILMLLCAVMMALLMRERPQKMGLKPYGEGEIIQHKKSGHHSRIWEGRSMAELCKKPAFYLMILSTFLSCLSVYLIFSNLSPHLQSQGLSSNEANTIHGLQLFFLAGTKFLVGALCDRLGSKKTNLICLVALLTGLTLLLFAKTMPAAVLGAAVFSIGVPLTGVTVPLLGADLFGYKAQGQYTGIFMATISASSILSGIISNSIFDIAGSYIPAIFLSMALSVGSFALYLILYRAAARDQGRWAACFES